jgi:predicted house-cleaning NTP pyrophosphatase (Maf/HAM1 superfamily)
MADKIRRLLNSPQGRQVVDRGRRELEKPENRRRVNQLLRRVSGRGRQR